MDVSTYGRNRQSIADLEQELNDIFQDHPQSHLNDSGEPVIPADALVDVLRTFSRNHDAVDLMTREEEDQLTQLIESNPGLAVTPQVLLQFIAMRTTFSPHDSPQDSPPPEDVDMYDRGRTEDREYEGHSRSSSRDSVGTYYRSSSRGPPVPPKTPFDSSRRQRSTPLANNSAPSSWTRRPPPSRRKSDAGQNRSSSDSESLSPFGASFSRPHSRAQSQPQARFSALDSAVDDYHYGSSPEREPRPPSTGLMSPPPSDSSFDEDELFRERISSLPMPRSADSDSESDSDGEDSTLGLVMDRSAASSTVSLDIQERLDALQRMNTELGRKLIEAEQTMSNRLAEHEQELEDMQSRLEEARTELSATKREEKELRSKERQASTQISALESEISKLQKSLDTARSSYQSLQRQYQEQCSESERYRNTLRLRDLEIKEYQEATALQTIEAQKWQREELNFEERIAFLENELAMAQQAHATLDEQKQENMMLKETIDRMRFDMDELRNSATGLSQSGGSGNASAQGTLSKSLGAELMSKMQQEGQRWEKGEDVVQTIITRTKRKVTSRAKRIETVKVDEVKEYSDTGTQHELSEFTSSTMAQTDPEPKVLTASFSVQTEIPHVMTMSTQTETDPAPEPVTVLTVNVQDQDELAIRVANETLKKWHKGLKLPIEPVAGGISEDALEDWKALKEELGVECTAIDKIVEESSKTGLPALPARRPPPRGAQKPFLQHLQHFLFCIGVSAAVAFLVGQAMAPQYVVPGGATYYDRAAWSSFNSIQAAGEGFPGDGTAVWGFLGRLGGGAARTLQGWPT
ncbi:hypothetical protein A0H81_13780 [Grifola frondosa]|uniref:Uncharacterized protein n=1 Tax=Grifola frondosa TaxID=5627 RepID=A0A1C7LNU6_GRIFR|nr:hypothetical protein A0H81_13780 [Grifola frondosa]